jgi:hypothetical protein
LESLQRGVDRGRIAMATIEEANRRIMSIHQLARSSGELI